MKKKICVWGLILSIIACMLPAGVMADSSLKIGDYLQMGTYYGEPIIWRCVDIDDKGPLMLSDKIICMKA